MSRIFSIFFFFIFTLYACTDGRDLGSGYVYNYGNHYLFAPRDGIEIPQHVLEYKFDKNFIIVRQSCMGGPPDMPPHVFYERIPYRTDSITFWLIDKRTNYNSGPLDTISFAHLCHEKGVTLMFGENSSEDCESWLESFLKYILPINLLKNKS